MSTKCTLAHGPNFHLYHDAFDDSNVYIELDGMHFEANSSRVMVQIPLPIWEVIRQRSGGELAYADKSDNEIQAYVEREVDERRKRYAEAGDRKQLIGLAGSLVFGPVDRPLEEQIASGVAHYTRLRAQHQEIKRAIAELEALNSSDEQE